MKNRRISTNAVLWRFGFRQSRRGALIMALIAGGEALLQGYAFAASYPSEVSRSAFAASLGSVPGLGIIYGEPNNLSSTAGYIEYRTVAFLGFVAAIWALVTVTRLLRGFEEDGRWEVITAGATSKRQASLSVLGGFFTSLAGAYLLTTLLLSIGLSSPSLELTVGDCFRMSAAIFLPALAFASLGYFTCQLAITRRRALSYSLYPLIGFFMLRALGNTIPDVYWLKNLTPFGWADRFSPILHPHYGWLIVSGVAATVFTSVSIYLVGKRDLGASLLHESDHARSKFFLLGSPAALSVRQTFVSTSAWAVAAITFSLMMAAIAKVAVQAINDSPSLKLAFTRIGSSNDVQIAFLGMGAVLTVMILLLVATAGIANIRSNEAKNYLDAILVAPTRRARFLASRLSIIAISLLVISLLSITATWVVTQSQHISLNLGNLLLIGTTLTGTAIFILGLGTLLYAVIPRFATVGMYIIIGWSFLLDSISSVVTLNDVVAKSSLFHYISPTLTAAPDWKTFAWLVSLGVAFAAAGIMWFNRRDIVSE